MILPPLTQRDCPGAHTTWSADAAVVTPYGAFDVVIASPKEQRPSVEATRRLTALAEFTHSNIERIVGLAHAHFRWTLRTAGEEAFRLMEIPIHAYTRAEIIRVAQSRRLTVVCDLGSKAIVWSGISLAVRYDEEHGLGMEFDGTDIVSIDGASFRLVGGELQFDFED